MLTVEGPDAYRLTVVGTLNGKPTKEVTVARRVGACTR
jgi:hypothetical protein